MCRNERTHVLYRYERYVEQAYVEYLKEQNRPDEVCLHPFLPSPSLFSLHLLLFSFSLSLPLPSLLHPSSIPPSPPPSPPVSFLFSPPPPQMQGVDPDGALKMFAEKGQWEKCLELAEKQVTIHHSIITTSGVAKAWQGTLALRTHLLLYLNSYV